jgi:hypothetical protein
MHDQKLGVDTRADDRLLDGTIPLAGMLPGDNSAQASGVHSASVKTAASGPGWYYAIDGQTFGPVPLAGMVQMLRVRAIPKNALFWIEGMADWAPVERVPEFNGLVNS